MGPPLFSTLNRNYEIYPRPMSVLTDIHDPAFEEMVIRQIKEDKSRFAQRKFAERSCPACASSDRNHDCASDGFHYQRCLGCGTLYLSPCPTEAEIIDFLNTSEGYRMWREDMPQDVRQRREIIYRERAALIQSLFPDGQHTGSVLDVGAGSGEFAVHIIKLGARYIGIEPQPLPFTIPGADIIVGTFADAVVPNPVDVVCAFEVIEHLIDPYEFLEFAKRALKRGGKLVVTTPNNAGFEIEVLGKLSHAIGFDHVAIYNVSSLRFMLDRAGFADVKISTPGRLDVALVERAWSEGKITLTDEMIARIKDSAFQAVLQAENRSSHMCAIATRTS
jgi:SAM-dependent methyltransferase